MWKLIFAVGLLLNITLANEQLARQRGCMACHDIKAKKVGPSYTDIAKKYKGKGDAVDYLTEKTLKGGAGVWGSIPMPPQKIPEAEARQIVQWILSLE